MKRRGLTGAWLRDGIPWTDAPTDVNTHLKTGEASLLYFKADHTFALLYCVVNRESRQKITKMAISHGDGQVVYLGQWSAGGDRMNVMYRLSSRTVEVSGEKLPGPAQHGTLKTTRGALVWDGKIYRRAAMLDASAAALVDGTLARQPPPPQK